MFIRMFKLSLLITVCSVIVFSCKKSELESPEGTNTTLSEVETAMARAEGKADKVTYAFYLDDQEVEEGAFSTKDTTLFFIAEGVEGSSKLLIRAYTSEELMNAYGDGKGWRLTLASEIEDHLYEYAVSSGAIKDFEKNGVVPEWYLEYQNAYIAEKMGVGEKSLIALLYEDLDLVGSSLVTFPLIGLPHLLYLNNQVSSFKPYYIGGVHVVYDKTFYRRRMITFAGYFGGYSYINFSGQFSWLNDKASSWWSYGL